MPFFLEPDYPTSIGSVETNRSRLLSKWGGEEGWNRQKRRHALKSRGQAVGIPYFNLDRLASNTLRSHRLIRYVTMTRGANMAELVYDKMSQFHFVDGKALNDLNGIVDVAAGVIFNASVASCRSSSFVDIQDGEIIM